MVDFDSLKDKAGDLAAEHNDQVDDAIDNAAEFAGNKVGHDEQIDQGAEKLKGMIPSEGEAPAG
jgi:hypothetical protein